MPISSLPIDREDRASKVSAFTKLSELLKKPLILYPLLVLATVFFSEFSTLRSLWYDEALTVMEFASLPDFSRVYFAYVIANNHIAFTLLLKLWLHGWELFFPITEFSARLLSLLLSTGFLLLLWHHVRRRYGFRPALVAVFIVAMSLPFPIYAVAVRGYALSFFLGVLAVMAVEHAVREPRYRFWCWMTYFMVAVSLVGTLPSNLLFFVGLCCFYFPASPDIARFRRWLPVAVLPPLAFLLFYFPIFSRLLNVMSHTHGWSAPFPAITDFYVPLLLACVPLSPIFVFASGCLSRSRRWEGGEDTRFRWGWIRCVVQMIPWLIPAVLMLIRTPSPFPRVFLILSLLYLLQGMRLLCSMLAFLRKTRGRRFVDILTLLTVLFVIVWSSVLLSVRPTLEKTIVPQTDQDDMIYPYFIRDFDPRSMTLEIRRRLSLARFVVFIGGSADPPSVFFAGNLIGIPPELWIYDRPKERVPDDFVLGLNLPVLLVVRDEGELASLQNRFSIRGVEFVADFGFQKLYAAVP
jgi:hypothetical protein